MGGSLSPLTLADENLAVRNAQEDGTHSRAHSFIPPTLPESLWGLVSS